MHSNRKDKTFNYDHTKDGYIFNFCSCFPLIHFISGMETATCVPLKTWYVTQFEVLCTTLYRITHIKNISISHNMRNALVYIPLKHYFHRSQGYLILSLCWRSRRVRVCLFLTDPCRCVCSCKGVRTAVN